jgi:hypothetical protein
MINRLESGMKSNKNSNSAKIARAEFEFAMESLAKQGEVQTGAFRGDHIRGRIVPVMGGPDIRQGGLSDKRLR